MCILKYMYRIHVKHILYLKYYIKMYVYCNSGRKITFMS